jgi:hypothetical protein
MSSDILEDFLELVPFARAIKRHPRTVRRWCKAEGLPYTTNGRSIVIHVPSYRDWLLGRMHNKGGRAVRASGAAVKSKRHVSNKRRT